MGLPADSPHTCAWVHACAQASRWVSGADCQRVHWPLPRVHATTCMPACGSCECCLVMRSTRPSQSSAGVFCKVTMLSRSVRHCAKPTCHVWLASLRVCKATCALDMPSKPRQEMRAMSAKMALATSTSIKVKPAMALSLDALHFGD